MRRVGLPQTHRASGAAGAALNKYGKSNQTSDEGRLRMLVSPLDQSQRLRGVRGRPVTGRGLRVGLSSGPSGPLAAVALASLSRTAATSTYQPNGSTRNC